MLNNMRHAFLAVSCAWVLAGPVSCAGAEPRRVQEPPKASEVRARVPEARVVVRPPTSQEAFDQLWSTLGDMNFFRAHGYIRGRTAGR